MEKQFYTMKECFDACGDDDVPYIEHKFNSLSKRTKKELWQKLVNEAPMLNTKDALSDKWQIKRAEPEVLSAEKLYTWFLHNCDHSELAINNFSMLVKKCRQNFRLERDKELREYVSDNIRSGSHIIKNWPPLTKDE